MRFVEEIVVDAFLPTVRAMLAERLLEAGRTQREVAELLGISQSAVSKYAGGGVERTDRIESDERVRETVDELAAGLASGEITRVQGLIELEVLIRELEDGDLLAAMHEEAVPELAEHGGGFRVHDPESELRTSERTLASLRRGLRTLESTSGFAGLLPNVGSNLVACVPGATTIDDVAAVPGRIVDVKGRATGAGDPEFGVSEHVAGVLLAAREAGSDARAAINVRYDPEIVATLEKLGHVAIEFSAEDDTAEAVGDAIAANSEATVAYQTGGFGVEPNVYVLAPDPESLARTVRELCRT
jgi:predicted fused transcriptional regulator/phosphomethylpyrimidine kinase/predicted transcriptional regulator